MADEYRLSYTGQQVDEAIGKALTGLPTITIAVSQVVSQSPVQVQLTDEQYQILANNKQVIFDASAFGMDAMLLDWLGSREEGGTTYLMFLWTFSSGTYLHYKKYTVNTATKVAELSNDELLISAAELATYADKAYSVDYTTTAPSSANMLSRRLEIVVLSSEPATRYDGYLYIITGSN